MSRTKSTLFRMALLLTAFLPTHAHSQAGCAYLSYALPDSVVPPLQGSGRGWLWTFDGRGGCGSSDSLTFSINYEGLDSEAIGASIHRGSIGENGELVLPLAEQAFPSGHEVTAYLDPAICEEIGNGTGSLYFILATTDHPEGALRGQVWIDCAFAVRSLTWGAVRSLYR